MKKLNLLKVISILLFSVIILYGCREELRNLNSKHEHSVREKYVSFKKFLEITHIPKQNFYKSMTAKGDIFNDFEVDTIKIRQTLRNNNLKAFSFRITPKNKEVRSDNIFYNLAFIKNDSGWNKYIVKYTSSDPNYISNLQFNPSIRFRGSSEVLYYKNSTSRQIGLCSITSNVEIWDCPEGHTKIQDCYESGYGPNCCWGNGCVTINSVTTIKDCSNANEGGGSPTDSDGDGFPDNGDGTSGGGIGDGSEFDVNLPVYDPNYKTPCEESKISLSTANSLLMNIDIKTKMNYVLKAKINATNEWAVSVGKNSDGTYSVSNPQEGNANNGTVPLVPSGNYVADGHTHSGDFGAPSAGDFYNMLQKSLTEPYFKTRYIYGNYFGDDEVYVLVIDNPVKVKQFLELYPLSSNYNTTSHSFLDNSDIGFEYNKAKNFYNQGTYINTGDDYIASSIGLAYVLQKFNTGVSLARMDANGNFKKIIVNEEQITIPGGNGTPKTGLNISKCQ